MPPIVVDRSCAMTTEALDVARVDAEIGDQHLGKALHRELDGRVAGARDARPRSDDQRPLTLPASTMWLASGASRYRRRWECSLWRCGRHRADVDLGFSNSSHVSTIILPAPTRPRLERQKRCSKTCHSQ